jgi:hypothetical protein
VAKLRGTKQIGPDVIEKAPDWAKLMIDILNPFIRDVFGALSAQLTFGDNFRNAIREFTFDTASNYASPTFAWTEIRFAHGLKTKAIGCRILQINEVGDNRPVITSAVDLNWIEIDSEIRIRYVAGLANDKKYTMRVQVF